MNRMTKILLLLVTGFSLFAAPVGNGAKGVPDPRFNYHIQGADCTKDFIIFSFTTYLVKTDWNCKILKVVPAELHSGDLCIVGDRIYCSVCWRKEGAYIAVYDLDLNLLRKCPLPKEVNAPDGITYHNGMFYIAQDDFGRKLHPMNRYYAFKEDSDFVNFCAVSELRFGVNTNYGTQTMMSFNGVIWAGNYSEKGKASTVRLIPDGTGKLKFDRCFSELRSNIGMFVIPEECGKGKMAVGSVRYLNNKAKEKKDLRWAPAYEVMIFDGKRFSRAK